MATKKYFKKAYYAGIASALSFWGQIHFYTNMTEKQLQWLPKHELTALMY